MSARIVSLASAKSVPAPVSLGLSEQAPARQQVWTGASGRHYVHSVYSLIECPPLPKASYLLVRREPDGRRVVLHVGQGLSDTATLNLARVRQSGAQLGVNEVHVHFSVASDAARSVVVCDLRAGQLGEFSSGPTRASA